MCKYCNNTQKPIFKLNFDNVDAGVCISYSPLAQCYCLDLAISDNKETIYSCASKIEYCPFCGYHFLDFE